MVKLKIDCQKILLTSMLLRNSAEGFIGLTNKMREISKNIQNCWMGVDATNFLSMFNETIDKLSEVNELYMQKSDAMKDAAKIHGTIDIDLKDIMKRSDFDV